MTPSPRADSRMISGAAISNEIFFEISNLAPDGRTAALQVLPIQEIWQESSGEPLNQLPGVLEFVGDDDVAQTSNLQREDAGYRVQLALPRGDHDALCRRLAGSGARLKLIFNVEYSQGFESPGGYSDAHGVRYWDDVTYPRVSIDGFEISAFDDAHAARA
ncbi:hypothetical protein [Phenylobacterium conjunctum]|uniref:Uncharacterized protein n=1 Tax=Phenylobacterium conjunctum TaxID=1298959 RepID=A0ABW3SXE2_9CAUL